MSKIVEFDVAMTCNGCATAVNRILSKIQGVEKIDANVEKKKVLVTIDDSVNESTLLSALMTWSNASGKKVALVQ